MCPALRSYLSEFLLDPRVIELPKLFRLLLVKGIIINVRAHRSAATYRKIWTDEGSPLLVNSAALASKVQSQLGNNFQVELAMRYGQPSVASKLAKLHRAGCRKVVVVPMYPQYSGSTNGSTFDAVAAALSKHRWVPDLAFVQSYAHRNAYIAAIGDSINQHWAAHGRAAKLVMSFHGIPQKYVQKGDPYQQQCQQSATAIANYLQLSEDQWMLVFQSRFGAEQWLQPYCDETLKQLPAQGVKSVDIVCPGFSVDCLETLEEIQMENREYFIESGGEQYNYIPCLNESDNHAAFMSEIVRDQQVG